jgi:deoxyribodipyrimidine photo-lyase
MSSKKSVSVFWFRRDLRLEDNTALQHALDSKFPVVPIFVFDPQILNRLESRKDARVQFILSEIQKIKSWLEELNTSVLIFHESPSRVFEQLMSQYDIRSVFANRDYEPQAIERDQRIGSLLADQKVKLHLFKDHVVFEGNELLKQDGSPYRVFTPFKRLWLQRYNEYPPESSEMPGKEGFLHMAPTPDFDLAKLGFEPIDIDIPTREVDLKTVGKYDKNRNFPAIEGTTRLGIHLRFGTVSIRKMAALAEKHNETWLNELIWREFYSAILQHFPHVVSHAFNKKYDHIRWRNDENEFQKWCTGTTGFPIVDAGMRQLNKTGYMHNRVRMVTASFLTKHLLIDWRWGEAYFASKLLDFELASNNGGWQWAAGTGTDAQPYFRVFNPESQTQKFDKNLDYCRQWIPELNTAQYPSPVVDHKSARIRAIETYKRSIS